MSEIRDYLKKNKITQLDFAASLGVNQSLVFQWTKGITGVSLYKALEIERLYGIDASLLNEDVAVLESKFTERRARQRKALADYHENKAVQS